MPEWQAAIEALMLVVERNGSTMLARIGPDLRPHQQAGWRPQSPQVFSSEAAAEKWFAENDPEGVAFEYPVEGV